MSHASGSEQVKLAALSMLPVPLYLATRGYGQSGRVRSTLPSVLWEATMRSGALPSSTHRSSVPACQTRWAPHVRDDRLLLRGKRKQRTSGVWRPGRIRGLLTNKTYMGIHEWGKRAVKKRSVISRPVPAIVTEATWKKAQKTLQENFLFGKRSAKLRGLIKCGVCGLTYIGVAANRPNGKREFASSLLAASRSASPNGRFGGIIFPSYSAVVEQPTIQSTGASRNHREVEPDHLSTRRDGGARCLSPG
jgi:hypothetical protein